MKIGMVLERDFPTTPPDIRVVKEMRSLLKAGHEVDLLSLQITSERSEDLFMGEVPVFRVPIPMLRIMDWDSKSVERHFHSPLSPWVNAIEEFVSERAVDALHVHDLPLAWTCAFGASRAGIPMVLDLHEVYPDLVRFMRPDTHGSWSPGDWVAEYEKECLRCADRIIVTVEESRQRLLGMGIQEEKVRVVMNTEAIQNMIPGGSVDYPVQRLRGKFIITYVGAFGEVRGLETLIRAVGKLSARNNNLHLLLVGAGYNQAELQSLIQELNLGDSVTITGWVPFDQVPDLIELSDICIVPHLKNPFTDTTVPHKLFQYMLLSKPVIVSDPDPLVRIVTECGCGLVFPSGDLEALANRIERLAADPRERQRLGRRGRIAALERYHWGKDEESLLDLYTGNSV